MLDYAATMRVGQARYQDVVDRLRGAGMPTSFTQTGGMNAALAVVLDGGYTLLVTDAEDSLSWDRNEHVGWGVGLYPPIQDGDDTQCLAHDSTEDGSVEALLPLVEKVLRRYVDQRRDLRESSGRG